MPLPLREKPITHQVVSPQPKKDDDETEKDASEFRLPEAETRENLSFVLETRDDVPKKRVEDDEETRPPEMRVGHIESDVRRGWEAKVVDIPVHDGGC